MQRKRAGDPDARDRATEVDGTEPASHARCPSPVSVLLVVAVILATICLPWSAMLGGPNASLRGPDTRAQDGPPKNDHLDLLLRFDALLNSSAGSNPTVVFNTSMGSFEAEIFLEKVPITASNFLNLVEAKFYDGLHFHRIIPDFKIDFGCPFSRDPESKKIGTGGPTDQTFLNLKTGEMERRMDGREQSGKRPADLNKYIPDELVSKDSNLPRTLSMENFGRANTGGSQFFINMNKNTYLDWFTPGPVRHVVFGRITEGWEEVVAKMNMVFTSGSESAMVDAPLQPIKMNSIRFKAI